MRGSGAPIFTHAVRSAICCIAELLALGGHLQVGVVVADGDDQLALGRVAGNDRPAPLSPPFCQPSRVSSTRPPLVLPARRCGTCSSCRQDRADLALEEIDLLLGQRRAGHWRRAWRRGRSGGRRAGMGRRPWRAAMAMAVAAPWHRDGTANGGRADAATATAEDSTAATVRVRLPWIRQASWNVAPKVHESLSSR